MTALTALLPRRLALGFGALLGGVAWRLLGRRRQLAEENMQRALTELSPVEVRRLVRRMFVHLGTVAMDLLMLKRFHAEADLSKYFDFENLERNNFV